MATRWFKVNFDDEKDEFDRVCGQLTGNQTDAQWEKNYAKLKTLYRNSSMIDMKPSTWNALGNTDSNKKMTMIDIKKCIQANKNDSGSRDIFATIAEVVSSSARAPIILLYRDRFTLIAGNTRLMACRLLDITPKVVVMHWK